MRGKASVGRSVNAALVTLYWSVGQRIRQDILQEKRAEYGGQIVSALGRELAVEFGRGFSEKNLRHMVRFAEAFPDFEIVSALRRQLGWTHFKQIIYMDLLFYNRKLRRLVVIDLKLGKFKAEFKGQMELYLRWLEKYEVEPGEETPIGLILCADKSEEQIELLRLSEGGIRVATYLTGLAPKKLLEKRLHEAVQRARDRLLPVDETRGN